MSSDQNQTLSDFLVGRGPSLNCEFSPGDLIGNQWEVQCFIGEGASAEVYEVRSPVSDQTGAVKVLRRQFVQHVGKAGQFRREVEVVAGLQNPWTVRLLDVGNLPDGRPFIVLERLTGRTLQALLRERKVESTAPYFGLRELADICICVLSGLQELHHRNWVHRDINPRNLQCVESVGTPLQVKVLDFGIAEQAFSRPDGTHRVLGSPHYVAPEVARGETVTPSSDLYSLGISLIELIVGEPPWVGRSPDDLLYSHMNPDLAVPIPEVALQHPLGGVIARAVAKSIDERFGSAMVMRGAIDHALAAT
jgi:serine/threonine protein kinase